MSPGATPPVDEPRALPRSPSPTTPRRCRGSARRAPLTPRRLARLAATWILVTLAMPLLVLYGFGPLLEQRAQRVAVDVPHRHPPRGRRGRHALRCGGAHHRALARRTGRDHGDRQAPLLAGDGRGRRPRADPQGPGGTSLARRGSANPGNAAVVGRRAGYGGPFSSLGSLRVGDAIVVTTTQGQTLYKVSQVRQVLLKAPASASSAASSAPGGATALVAGRSKPVMTTAELYAPSNDNRLTAVTSDAALPWATHR